MKLRYFCESCGKEVPRGSARCPHCGKYFSSVQCPRCGHRGEDRDFETGCPECGYMRLPHSELSPIGLKRVGGFGLGPGPRGPTPLLYRVLLLVLVLAMMGIVALLFLKR